MVLMGAQQVESRPSSRLQSAQFLDSARPTTANSGSLFSAPKPFQHSTEGTLWDRATNQALGLLAAEDSERGQHIQGSAPSSTNIQGSAGSQLPPLTSPMQERYEQAPALSRVGDAKHTAINAAALQAMNRSRATGVNALDMRKELPPGSPRVINGQLIWGRPRPTHDANAHANTSDVSYHLDRPGHGMNYVSADAPPSPRRPGSRSARLIIGGPPPLPAALSARARPVHEEAPSAGVPSSRIEAVKTAERLKRHLQILSMQESMSPTHGSDKQGDDGVKGAGAGEGTRHVPLTVNLEPG